MQQLGIAAMTIQGINHFLAESQPIAPVLYPWVRTRRVSRRNSIRILEHDRDLGELEEIRHGNRLAGLVALRRRDFSFRKDVVGWLVGVDRPHVRALDARDPAQYAASRVSNQHSRSNPLECGRRSVGDET